MANGECAIGASNKEAVGNLKGAITRIDRSLGRIFVGQLAVLCAVIAGLVVTIITRSN